VFLINLVITAVIYVIAVKITLPTEKMMQYVEDAAHDSEDEDEDEDENEGETLAGRTIA
jgi:hypothetical protein